MPFKMKIFVDIARDTWYNIYIVKKKKEKIYFLTDVKSLRNANFRRTSVITGGDNSSGVSIKNSTTS